MKRMEYYICLTVVFLLVQHSGLFKASATEQNVWKYRNSCIWIEEKNTTSSIEDVCSQFSGHVFILNDTDAEIAVTKMLDELNGTSAFMGRSVLLLLDYSDSRDNESSSTLYSCMTLLNGMLLETNCSSEELITLCETDDLWQCRGKQTNISFDELYSETSTMSFGMIPSRKNIDVTQFLHKTTSMSSETSTVTSSVTNVPTSSMTSSIGLSGTNQIPSMAGKMQQTGQGLAILSDELQANGSSVSIGNNTEIPKNVNSSDTLPESLSSLNTSQALTTSTQKSSVVTPCEMLQIPSNHGIRNVTFCDFLFEIVEKSNISDIYETTVSPATSLNVTIATPDLQNSSTVNNQTSHYHGPPVTDVKFQVSGMNNGSVRPWMGGKLPSQPVAPQVPPPKIHNISKELNAFKQLDHVDNITLKDFSDTVVFAGEDKHISEETEDVKTSILENIIDVGEHLVGNIHVSMKSIVMETDGIGVISKLIVYDEMDTEEALSIRSQHDKNYIQLSKKVLDSQDRTNVRISALTYKKIDSIVKASNKHISSNVVSVIVHYIHGNHSETAVIRGDNAILFDIETDIDKSKHEEKRLCTFWDFNERIWSTSGCKVKAKNTTHTSCQCNHLTSFAILVMYMDTTEISPRSQQALFTMTTVGCSLSITCLAMTLICYIYLRMLPKEKIMIHANLCIALLSAQIVFVSSSDAHHDSTACKVVAILLHFFFMASFAWMMVEGIALYLCCTKGIFQHRDMRIKYFLVGWGLPVVIVVISLAARFPDYGSGPQYSCWLSVRNGLIWAFLGPMLIIILMNIGVMGLVVKVFLTLRANADKTEVARLRGSVRAMLTLLPLLGITWILSLLVPFSVVFHYLFVIANTVQGMCIFFLHCICNDEIRKKFYEKRRKWSTTRTASDPEITFPSRRKTGSFDAIRAAAAATQLQAEYATRTAWA